MKVQFSPKWFIGHALKIKTMHTLNNYRLQNHAFKRGGDKGSHKTTVNNI